MATLAVDTEIRITAGDDTFFSSDVGKQLWARHTAPTGGGGKCRITEYIDSTEVRAIVIEEMEENVLISGEWEIAVKELNNLHLFEGQTMQVQADGGPHPDCLVTNGSITLNGFYARVHVGFKYTGLVVTQNLDFGGRLGPANSKPRNIKRIRARFSNTGGCKIGPTEYTVKQVVFNTPNDPGGRVPPPFTGMKDLTQLDSWNAERKNVVVIHDEPSPCTVLGLDIEQYTVEPP